MVSMGTGHSFGSSALPEEPTKREHQTSPNIKPHGRHAVNPLWVFSAFGRMPPALMLYKSQTIPASDNSQCTYGRPFQELPGLDVGRGASRAARSSGTATLAKLFGIAKADPHNRIGFCLGSPAITDPCYHQPIRHISEMRHRLPGR